VKIGFSSALILLGVILWAFDVNSTAGLWLIVVGSLLALLKWGLITLAIWASSTPTYKYRTNYGRKRKPRG
jgi:hypothetical protein